MSDSDDMLELTHVQAFDYEDFGGDPYEILYVDGKVVVAGDYYHNKISAQIGGFLSALRFTGTAYTCKKVRAGGDNLGYKAQGRPPVEELKQAAEAVEVVDNDTFTPNA